LSGAIKAVNTQETNRIAVLNDSTKSIEQQAMALGISTDDIYENTKATKSNEGSIKALERQIKRKERALEDETKAIKTNISAIEGKRERPVWV
jgi:hypothetical protein